MEQKTAEQAALEVKAQFDAKLDVVKDLAEKAIGMAERGETATQEFKGKADEALLAMNGLKAQFTELEQKALRHGGQDEVEKTLGQSFVDSDEFKSFKATGFGRSDKAVFEQKATLTLATTNAAGSVGSGSYPTRLPGVIALPQRRMTVRDLITQGRMDGNTLDYVKETGFNNAAAPVAEGALKPSSDIQLTSVQTSAKVIAHWIKVSRQALDDVSMLSSMIDQRLRYGLAMAEEAQLLKGDGTGQNLLGIIPQATAYSLPTGATAGTTNIDKLRLMMLQAALAEYPASGHVMNPIDWANIELTKDGESRYLIGNPQGTLSPTLWGLPVVATQAMTVGSFLTGAFELGAQLFDRWTARVETAYVADDFIRNLVTILAEERLALAVYRPQAFIYSAPDV